MDRQLTLDFVESLLSPEEHWESGDDWETPDSIARAMANLLLPSDKRVLEPSAGTGQIVKFLPSGISQDSTDKVVWCLEPNPKRFQELRKISFSPFHEKNGSVRFPISTLDFFEDLNVFPRHKFDLLITNPPFSKIKTFVQHGLTLLSPENPTARLLYLLPIDWMSLKSVSEWWKDTDAHIHHVYAVEGRIAYLKNGVPISGRRRNDAIFDIRPGRDGAAISYLEV